MSQEDFSSAWDSAEREKKRKLDDAKRAYDEAQKEYTKVRKVNAPAQVRNLEKKIANRKEKIKSLQDEIKGYQNEIYELNRTQVTDADKKLVAEYLRYISSFEDNFGHARKEKAGVDYNEPINYQYIRLQVSEVDNKYQDVLRNLKTASGYSTRSIDSEALLLSPLFSSIAKDYGLDEDAELAGLYKKKEGGANLPPPENVQTAMKNMGIKFTAIAQNYSYHDGNKDYENLSREYTWGVE